MLVLPTVLLSLCGESHFSLSFYSKIEWISNVRLEEREEGVGMARGGGVVMERDEEGVGMGMEKDDQPNQVLGLV